MTQRDNIEQSSLLTQQPAENKQLFFHLIQKVGAMGRYQVSLLIVFICISTLSGATTLMTPFLFYQSHYNCDQTYSSKQCFDYVCSLPLEERKSYIPTDPYIHSFANKFGDYRCPNEQSELDLIKSLFYFGKLMGFLSVAFIGDVFRSKILVISGTVITLIGILMMTLTDIFWLSIVGIFVMPMGLIISYNLAYIFITEMVEENSRQKYKMVISSIYSVGGLLDVLMFFIAPNFEIILLGFFGISLLIVCLFFIFFFTDTPNSMITKNTPEKTYKNLLYIAKINGKREIDLTIEDIKQVKYKYQQQIMSQRKTMLKSFTIIDLFRYKSLRWLTVMVIFVDIFFFFQYITPTLMLNQFKFSIFLNGTVIQSAQLFAGVIGFFTIMKFKRRTTGIVSYVIILVCSVVLIFIWDQDETEITDIGSNVIVLILLFVIEMIVSNAFNFFAIYLNEIFPTQVRVIGVGFVKTFAAMTSMVASQIIDACLNGGFKIMILFTVMALLSIGLYIILPQTFGKRPPEIIRQLQIGQETSGDYKNNNI